MAIKRDEYLQIFKTAAVLDPQSDEWHVPIHAWIYENDPGWFRRRVAKIALRLFFGLSVNDDTRENFTRRLQLLIADNERGKRLTARLGARQYALPPTDRLGHTLYTLRIAAEQMPDWQPGGVATLTIEAGGRTFQETILLHTAEDPVLISDIDDTVKISQVGTKALLLDHTFLQDFAEVPGMAGIYRTLARRSVSLYFVSSSPWQLYAPLREFLARCGFPEAVLQLKRLRFRDRTLLNLFKSGLKTKPRQLLALFEALHPRRFILIGDSGEQDPEVYTECLTRHPDKIIAVLIRNVTRDSPDHPRYARLRSALGPKRFALFDDAELAAALLDELDLASTQT